MNNNQNNNMMNNNTSSNQQLGPPPYTAENVDASPIPPPPAYSSPSSSAIPVANNNTPNATNNNSSADAAATTATTDGAAKAKPPSFLQQLNKKDNRPIGKLEISKEDRSVTSIHLETKNVVNQQSMPIIDGVCPRQLFEIQQDLEQQYQTLFGNNNSNAVDGAAAKPLVAFAINVRENWEDHLSLFNGVDPMVRNIILSSEGTITYTKVNNNKKDYYVIIYGVNFKVGEHGPELVHLEKNLKKKDPNDEKKMIPVKGWHNITTLYFGKVGDKEDEFAFDTPDAERTMMVWIQGSPRVVQEICKKYKIDKKVSNEKLKNKMHNIHVSILVTTYKKILDEEKDTKFTIQDCEPMLSSANGANFHRGTLKLVPSASLGKIFEFARWAWKTHKISCWHRGSFTRFHCTNLNFSLELKKALESHPDVAHVFGDVPPRASNEFDAKTCLLEQAKEKGQAVVNAENLEQNAKQQQDAAAKKAKTAPKTDHLDKCARIVLAADMPSSRLIKPYWEFLNKTTLQGNVIGATVEYFADCVLQKVIFRWKTEEEAAKFGEGYQIIHGGKKVAVVCDFIEKKKPGSGGAAAGAKK